MELGDGICNLRIHGDFSRVSLSRTPAKGAEKLAGFAVARREDRTRVRYLSKVTKGRVAASWVREPSLESLTQDQPTKGVRGWAVEGSDRGPAFSPPLFDYGFPKRESRRVLGPFSPAGKAARPLLNRVGVVSFCFENWKVRVGSLKGWRVEGA